MDGNLEAGIEDLVVKVERTISQNEAAIAEFEANHTPFSRFEPEPEIPHPDELFVKD